MCHPGYICHNRQSAKTSDAVNVCDTTNSASPKTAQIWCQIGIYHLTFQHKRILQTPGMWLDDEIVAATQHLLSLQYPAVGGLQPPVVVTSLSIEPQTHEFVQVVNVANNHWIVLYIHDRMST
jgi:hypothetical protein